jgi:hypothetical protein
MSLSELQRQNLIVKFSLENSNKSKSDIVEYFNTRNPLFMGSETEGGVLLDVKDQKRAEVH